MQSIQEEQVKDTIPSGLEFVSRIAIIGMLNFIDSLIAKDS